MANKKERLTNSERFYGFVKGCGILITKLVEGFRLFCFKNNAVLDLLFTIIYTAEQAGLIIFTYFFKDKSEVLVLGVSFFALIVIFTFSLNKLLMESRIKYLEKQVQEYIAKNNIMVEKSELMVKNQIEKHELIKKMLANNVDSQHLNNAKSNKKSRGGKDD